MWHLPNHRHAPTLLKPKGDHQSQVIVSGRPHADRTACDYYDSSGDTMKEIEGTVSRLAGQYEIIMTQIP